MDKSKLNRVEELFALPIKMKMLAKLDDMELYGNDKLKKNYVKAMEATSSGKPIAKTVAKLISENRLVPCFMNKNLKSLVKFKMFGTKSNKSVAGFYYPSTKQIYMFIDNNMTLGFANNHDLAIYTKHEGMHMLSYENSSKFLSMFKNDLSDFYFHLFNMIFEFKEKPKNIDKIVLFIYKNFEKSNGQNNAALAKYFKFLKSSLEKYSNLDTNEFAKRLTDYIVILKIFMSSSEAFMRHYKNFTHIIGAISRSYEKAFNITELNSFCIQELAYPSEVIAILSEKKENKAFEAFNKL